MDQIRNVQDVEDLSSLVQREGDPMQEVNLSVARIFLGVGTLDEFVYCGRLHLF